MLLLGGSAVVNALTGVNIYAASFLIPLGVIVYTLAGGLKATFLASYIHSVIGICPFIICSGSCLLTLRVLLLIWALYFVFGSSARGFSRLCLLSLHSKQ